MIRSARDVEVSAGPDRYSHGDGGDGMLLSEGMRHFAAVAAASALPVLLQGETGVGKSHLAALIHRLGTRRCKPFVPVNCGAVPHELFEREMFGNVRGAFTGAIEARPGLFEAADGGTLFLDEIGELPLALQPKLLRVLEEGAVRRVGATQQTKVDVRIVTATNRDLREQVEQRSFREDLYYRCCVLEYRLPPLRERRAEIPAIVHGLLLRAAPDDRAPVEVRPDAMERICAYDWPGNIRELSNVLSLASVYAPRGEITVGDLPERVRNPRRAAGHSPGEPAPRPPRRVRARYAAPADAETERHLILGTLAEEGENRTRAAERLGMCRATLWMKMKQYGIE